MDIFIYPLVANHSVKQAQHSLSAWAGLLPHSAGLVNATETGVFMSSLAGHSFFLSVYKYFFGAKYVLSCGDLATNKINTVATHMEFTLRASKTDITQFFCYHTIRKKYKML